MGAILNSIAAIHGVKNVPKGNQKKSTNPKPKHIITKQSCASEEFKRIFDEYDKTKNVGDLFFNLQCFFNGVSEEAGSKYHLKIAKYYKTCEKGSDNYKPTKLWGITQLGNVTGNESDVDDKESFDETECDKFTAAYLNIMNDTPNANVPDNDDNIDLHKIDLGAISDTERAILGSRNLTKAMEMYCNKKHTTDMKYLGEINVGIFKRSCVEVGDAKTFKTPFGDCKITRTYSTEEQGKEESKKIYKDKIESHCGGKGYSYRAIADQLNKLTYNDLKLCMHIIKDFLNVKWDCRVKKNHKEAYNDIVQYATTGGNIDKFNENLSEYQYSNDEKESIRKALTNLCGMAMVSEPLRSCEGGYNQRAVYDAICHALDKRELSHKTVRSRGVTIRKNLVLLKKAREAFRRIRGIKSKK